MPERDPFPGWGMPPRHLPTKEELEEIARRSWFVRMAEHKGYVLAPGSWRGKAAALAALWPDVFPTEAMARKYADIDRMEFVEAHWGEEIVSARVRLPGRRSWFQLRLHATTDQGAIRKLKQALPEGSEIDLG